MSKLNNFIALDISDNSLEVIECQRDFWGRHVIKKINRLSLDRGVIVNGDIKNANALVKVLKKLFKTAKPSPITSTNCLLSIPENKVFTHIFYVPLGLKNDDIEDFLLNQSEGIIPFNKETIISDYDVVDVTAKEKVILYAAAPRKLVNDVLAVLKSVKINVLLIELESLSVARSLLTKPFGKDANMILDIGGNFSNITIFDRQGLKLTVSLPLAGNQFTKEIRMKTKLTVAKATELKKKQGLQSSNKKAVQALRGSIDKIIEEITRSINYFEKKTDQVVKHLLLVGGSAKLPGIVDYLASKIKIEIISGNPWHRLRKSAEVLRVFKKRQGILYSTVIGLILRGKQKNYRAGINLLPSNIRKGSIMQLSSGGKHDWIKYVVFGLIVVVFVLLLVFKDDIRGDRQISTVARFDTVEKRVTAVVSYDEETIEDFAVSRIKGEIVNQSGTAEEAWVGVTTNELTVLAQDHLFIYNHSNEDVTLLVNSRLSAGEDVFYLAEPLRLAPDETSVVQVVRQDDKPVVLTDGIYKFIALSKARQELIYGEKRGELDIIPPEQISQIDITSIIQLQELLRQRVQQNSYSQLTDGIYIDEPLSSKINDLKYIRMGEGQIGLRMSAEYQWIKLDMDDLIALSLSKLGANVSDSMLQSADIDIVKNSYNDTEKVVGIDVVWTIAE